MNSGPSKASWDLSSVVRGALTVVCYARVGRGDDICVRNCVFCYMCCFGVPCLGCGSEVCWMHAVVCWDASRGLFGGVLGVFRGLLGGSWCLLGASRESLKASGGRLESLWENLGAILGQSARKAWGGPLFWLPLGARAEVLARLDW